MMHHVPWLIAVACLASIVAPRSLPAQLRGGAAAVDVTPQQFPLNMPGGFSKNMADKAHDPLHARALALSDGTTTAVIVVVDNLGVAREVVDEAKAAAAKRCDVPAANMVISATHTHSAPASNVREGTEPEVAYRKLLVDGIAEAIVRAHGQLRPAAAGWGVSPLPEEVFNRRWFLKPGTMPLNPFGEMDLVKMNPPTTRDALSHPAGPTDPDVSVLSLRDAQTKKPLALYANYALHYVGGTPVAQVSADYFGEFARVMPFRMGSGGDFVPLLSNGASGDINNIPFGTTRAPREPFEQIRLVALKTADAAWRAHSEIKEFHSDLRIGMRQRMVTLKHRRPTEAQIARAKEILALTDPAELAKLPPLAEIYARRTLDLAAAGETLEVPLQALHLGDLAIVAIPFETFCEIGLDLKKRSPFGRTIVVSIANGYNGYLPTPEQHRLGGYETWLGTNKVQPETSVILTNHLLEMLAELHAAAHQE